MNRRTQDLASRQSCEGLESISRSISSKHFFGFPFSSCVSGTRKAPRQDTKVRAVPLFEVAEEAVGAVSDAVTDVVSEAAPTVSVSSDVLDAYQSTAGLASAQAAEASAAVAVAQDSGLPVSPVVLGAAAVLVIGGPLLAFALRPSEKSISAPAAFNLLAEVPGSVLIDLRPKSSVDSEGKPDLRSVGRKKYVKMPTDEEEFDIEAFAKIVAGKEYVIFIDSYGGFAKKATKSLQAAKDLFEGEVAYVVDGTDGPAGWRNQEMPWRKPFSLSLPSVDALVENYKNDPSPTNTALTILGGLSLGSYVFVEYEGLVELLTVFVAGGFLAKKFLLAEDRETTNKQIMEFLNTKKAPEDLVKDIESFKENVVPESAAAKVDAPAKVEKVVEKKVEKKVEEKQPAPVVAEKKVEEKKPAPIVAEKKVEEKKPAPVVTPKAEEKKETKKTVLGDEGKSLLSQFGLSSSGRAEDSVAAAAAAAASVEETKEEEVKSDDKSEVENWISDWKSKTKDLQEMNLSDME